MLTPSNTSVGRYTKRHRISHSESSVYFRTWTLVLLFMTVGCGGQHIKEYEPKRRDYQLPVEFDESDLNGKDGSLWHESSNRNYFYSDQRAARLGDIVTVKIEEFADAQRDSSTSLSRKTEINAEIRAFLSVVKRLQDIDPNLDPATLVGASSENNFDSSGATGRSERLVATVPVVVRKVLPNGNLFVEGYRVILVNSEEHHFYISGVARPFDIDQTNSISSTRLAEAEIEFTGRGVLTEQQDPGWFSRWFGWVWPF